VRTYGKRRWCWVPADHDHPEWDRRLGNLTLLLQHAKTGWGRNLEIDTYAIEEQPLVGAMGRKFLLLNLTDPEQEDVYETIVGPESSCSCKAGKCRVPGEPEVTDGCKHRDGINCLIAEGLLDDEEARIPVHSGTCEVP
jgi:hypothetical protein